jgi:hypothetical protein
MEALKCRFCGERHWGSCPGLDRSPERKPTKVPKAKPVGHGLTVGERGSLPLVNDPVVKPATYRVTDVSDANTFMVGEAPSGYARVKRWRAANRERYNEAMRVYRARKRGE